MQDVLHIAATEFHRTVASVLFLGPNVFGVTTASQVHDLVESHTVDHDSPLFSRQHFGPLVTYTQLAGIRDRLQKVIYMARLKDPHFRQLPRLTTSRPLPHEETSSIQQLELTFVPL